MTGNNGAAMTVTMQQIADRCGVSKQTVSCILNGKGHLYAAATRERVEQVAQSLGYRPNLAATAVARRRHGCIGLALSAEQHNTLWTAGLYLSIAEAAARHGSLVMLLEIPPGRDTLGFFRTCGNLPCDGLLLNYVHVPSRGILAALAASDKPAVWMNNRLAKNAVYPDDHGAAVALTRRILEHGHRRIAYVNVAGVPLETIQPAHYSMTERWQGYVEAMAAAGEQPRLLASREKPHGIRNMISAAREAFAAPDRPTAVIAYGADGAEAVLHAARMEGLAIPGDLAVATFADARPIILGLFPETAAIPFDDMGRQSVEMLFEIVAQPRKHQPSQRLPYHPAFVGNLLTPPSMDGRKHNIPEHKLAQPTQGAWR
jgi:LacI family transcriptional regulator